jgi:hypothetical protein
LEEKEGRSSARLEWKMLLGVKVFVLEHKVLIYSAAAACVLRQSKVDLGGDNYTGREF